MADKSFEEQVRHELGGLQLNPDAEVWEGIEAELRKERKQRWMIWLFLLGILCGSGLVFTFYELHVHDSNNLTEKNHRQPYENAVRSSVTRMPDKQEKAADRIAVVMNTEREQVQRNETSDNTFDRRKYIESKVANTQNKPDTDLPSDKPEKGESAQSASRNPVLSAILNLADTISSEKSDSVLAKTKSNNQQQSAASEGKPKKTSRQPWQLYGAIDIGGSGIVKSAANAFPPAYFSALSSGGIVLANPGSLSANGRPYQHIAPSFGLSVDAIRQLGKRRDIGVSIGYYQLRSATAVGVKTYGTIPITGTGTTNENGYYYTGGNQHPYANQYHFLQAGFSLYTRYKIHNSFAFRWQIGAAASWLFGSNALHYDYSQQVFFHNNQLLTHVQGSLLTGIDFVMGKRKILYAGPLLNYYFSTLSSMPGAANQHLLRVGVKASILLSKKKK